MDADTRAIWLAHVRFRAYCRLTGIPDEKRDEHLKSGKGLAAFRNWMEPMWKEFRALKRCEISAEDEQKQFDAWLLELSPEGSPLQVRTPAPPAKAKKAAEPKKATGQMGLFG